MKTDDSPDIFSINVYKTQVDKDIFRNQMMQMNIFKRCLYLIETEKIITQIHLIETKKKLEVLIYLIESEKLILQVYLLESEKLIL